MQGRIYVGDRAPKAYVLVLTREDGDSVDLSTVSAAILHVTRAGADVTWSATISGQSATGLTLTHVLASDGSDVTTAGLYAIYAELTVPGGSLTSDTYDLRVRDRKNATASAG